jgi:hypothetical protein
MLRKKTSDEDYLEFSRNKSFGLTFIWQFLISAKFLINGFFTNQSKIIQSLCEIIIYLKK